MDVTETFTVGPTIGRTVLSIPSRYRAGEDFVFSKRHGSFWVKYGDIKIEGGTKVPMYLKDGLFHVRGEVNTVESGTAALNMTEGIGGSAKQSRRPE